MMRYRAIIILQVRNVLVWEVEKTTREWLVKKRKQMGLSTYKAARICGISQRHFSAIELGQRNPSVDLAKQMAPLFDENWTKFFDDDEQIA